MKRAILNDSELADLMRASQDGDGHAYAALLEAIAPIVRKTVLRQTAAFQRHEAEDIVQDVLVALHVARATYDPARPFLPWLAGIARIRISDTTRRNARRAARELTVADVPETSCAAEANIFGEEYRDPEALRQDQGIAYRATASHRAFEAPRNVAQGGCVVHRHEHRRAQGRHA
ncbi:MAG: RNA polymerase [Mesorhizobium sp.]|nr:MAG: RNA polymerase [Mesorhizobium sp.]TIO72968.1 MAG: RNA polymerase [Mesorhizobium sp.]TIO80986.1 MAG: RNA polymerase [Mesorhizobium sp.]TJV47959.1 MAG: RNA polymerase [Mesorhizobium sp.]